MLGEILIQTADETCIVVSGEEDTVDLFLSQPWISEVEGFISVGFS